MFVEGVKYRSVNASIRGKNYGVIDAGEDVGASNQSESGTQPA